MYVNIVNDNLTEDEAFNLEREIIHDYVFNKNYGIDIIGYKKYDDKHYLTNSTFGGDGSFGMVHSDEWCKQHSKDMLGESNPMFGVNIWETYDDIKTKEVKDKISLSSTGENNPMFGVSPKERMSEEKYKEWYKSTSERLKNQTGCNNPNAKDVSLYDINGNFIEKFNSLTDCAYYLINNYGFDSSLDNIRSCIGKAVRKNKPYKNYIFK